MSSVGILLGSTTLLLVAILFLKNRLNPYDFKIFRSGIGLLLMISFFSFIWAFYERAYPEVTFNKVCRVFSRPSEEAFELNPVTEGMNVRILQILEGGWVKIHPVPSDQIGYVSSQCLSAKSHSM